MQEIQKLLTYEQPKLLCFNVRRSSKTNFFGWLHFGICSLLAVFSCVCVIDLIDTRFTNAIMTGVYGIVQYFAPDIELFSDDSNITFVSKIFNIYDDEFLNDVFYHLSDYDDILMGDGYIKYSSKTYSKIKSPCNGTVLSVEWVDNENMLVIKIDEKTVITISGKIIFGVEEGDIIYSKQILGINYNNDHLITLRIYKNGNTIDDVLQFSEWL